MTPTYLNSKPHPPYYSAEVCEDQHHQIFSPKLQSASSSSSSLSYSMLSNVTRDQGHCCWEAEQLVHQQEDGSYDHSPIWEKNEDSTKDDHGDYSNSANWISSKTNLMGKMDQSSAMKIPINTNMPMFGDRSKQVSYSSLESDNHCNISSNITIRVCSDCNTTKTPLWRSGPRGPKSLCNACGIRQRKARRAMAAAANGTILATTSAKSVKTKMQHKENKLGAKGYVAAEYKKGCKQAASTSGSSSGRKNNNKLCFEDFISISLRKNSSFHQFFPQDEKEAAILLMALSSGLVHG